MSYNMCLFLLFLAQYACFAALFDIFGSLIHEFIDCKKDGKRFSFTIMPRGSGESNASRGCK